jgi:hypothetical protein
MIGGVISVILAFIVFIAGTTIIPGSGDNPDHLFWKPLALVTVRAVFLFCWLTHSFILSSIHPLTHYTHTLSYSLLYSFHTHSLISISTCRN